MPYRLTGVRSAALAGVVRTPGGPAGYVIGSVGARGPQTAFVVPRTFTDRSNSTDSPLIALQFDHLPPDAQACVSRVLVS
jgi:hypothetical protein